MFENRSNNKRTHILIDWLQVYCIGTLKNSNILIYKELEYGTKTFSKVINLIYQNEHVATLAYLPRSKVIHPQGALIKLKNNSLYSDDRINLLQLIINETGFAFKSISRLDLCIDFNNFNNNYDPEKFIKDYLQFKITKKGKNKGTVHFWQSNQIKFETLKFGKNTSDVSFYLYNKSKELQDVVYKKYIVDNWIKQGLNTKNTVWRLECSIKGNKYKIVNKDTGEIQPVSLSDLDSIEKLEGIFFYYYHKNFEFKINNNTKNKSRKENIKLFTEIYDLKYFTPSFKTDEAGRMEKIFIKMLENYNCEIRETNRYYKNDMKQILLDYCSKKGMLDFYYEKIETQIK
jgi:hypothetical protein